MITAFIGVVNVGADKAGIIKRDRNHPLRMQPMLEKHWQIAPKISAEADANLGKYPPFLRQILFNRGYADEAAATRFLAGLQVWGTPEQVTEQMIEHQRMLDSCGVIGVFSYGGMPDPVAKSNLQLFAEKVLPRLKQHDAGPPVGAGGGPTRVAGG